jgi:uncharacterized protein
MVTSLRHGYIKLHPFIRVCIFLGGNFLLLFGVQFAGPLGEMAVNVFLCAAVILFTKLILYLEARKLNTIGWRPRSTRHWVQLLTGTMIGMLMLIGTTLFIKWQTGFRWQNTPLPWSTILVLIVTVLASAYSQELIFRGYPFQLLLKKYGVWPAQIIMAVFFGLMHIGNMPFSEIIATMFTTGIGALLFGLAYIKTNNLALPTGIHFGWNFLQILLPRHPSLNGKGIVKIIEAGFNQANLTIFIWMLPYVFVMIVGYISISVFYRKQPSGNYV